MLFFYWQKSLAEVAEMKKLRKEINTSEECPLNRAMSGRGMLSSDYTSGSPTQNEINRSGIGIFDNSSFRDYRPKLVSSHRTHRRYSSINCLRKLCGCGFVAFLHELSELYRKFSKSSLALLFESFDRDCYSNDAGSLFIGNVPVVNIEQYLENSNKSSGVLGISDKYFTEKLCAYRKSLHQHDVDNNCSDDAVTDRSSLEFIINLIAYVEEEWLNDSSENQTEIKSPVNVIESITTIDSFESCPEKKSFFSKFSELGVRLRRSTSIQSLSPFNNHSKDTSENNNASPEKFNSKAKHRKEEYKRHKKFNIEQRLSYTKCESIFVNVFINYYE